MATRGGLRVEVRGVDLVKRNMKKFRAEVANFRLGQALFLEGHGIMNKAMRIAPVDMGDLRSTGKVTIPKRRRGQVTVTVEFGGPRAPYAVVQHERLDYRHTAPQSAKYLEIPFMEAVPGLHTRVGRRIMTRHGVLGAGVNMGAASGGFTK